jgi:hypothetical protein
VDDRQARLAAAFNQPLHIWDDPGDAADIIAKTCAEAARLGEIALHVDDYKCDRIALKREGEGLGEDISHQ